MARINLLPPNLVAREREVVVKSRQDVLTQLSKTRNSWHALLAHMGTMMPRQIWITELGANKGVVLLKGGSLGYVQLAGFVNSIEKDEMFSDLLLTRTEQKEFDPVTRFEIAFKVKGR